MTQGYKILFLSTNEWSDLWRRRQRLAYELSRQPEVASVLFVTPPVQTSLLDLLRGKFMPSHLGDARTEHWRAIVGQPRQVSDRVWVYTGSQKMLPLTRLEIVRKIDLLNRINATAYVQRMRSCLNRLPGDRLIVYLSHPLHAFALDAFRSRILSCYDWTDDWTQFELIPLADRDEYLRLNEQVPRTVDAVFAVSQQLYERAQSLNPHTYWLPNATSLYAIPTKGIIPDPVIAATPSPRLGYIGQIGDRVDFDLLRQVAVTHPDWTLIMVGPVWENRVARAEELKKLPNVHFIGARPYAALPGILQQLDVCLIPHTIDRLTDSMDPIKIYDYMSSSKPIVTTRVAGVDRFADVVYIADSTDTFIQQIGIALEEKDSSLAKKRFAYSQENAWYTRVQEFWSTLRGIAEEEISQRCTTNSQTA